MADNESSKIEHWDVMQIRPSTKPAFAPLLKDLPADQFRKHPDLFNGPFVSIKVGESEATQIFTLPKKLLSYYFMYFARDLNKVFKEGIDNKIELKECTDESFDLVVQWCYNGQLVLPAVPDEEKSKKIDRYLNFLVLADYLLITTSIDSVISEMRVILLDDPEALTIQQIRKAVEKFPSAKTHSVHKLFAEASIHLWMSQGSGWSSTLPLFNFQREVENCEAFASDVLKAVGETKRYGVEDLIELRLSSGWVAPSYRWGALEPSFDWEVPSSRWARGNN